MSGIAAPASRLNQGTLLSSLWIFAMVMVFLPRVLPRNANRAANIVAGAIHTLAVTASLFVGSGPAPYYAFCVAFEIPATIAIIVIAATWKKQA